MNHPILVSFGIMLLPITLVAVCIVKIVEFLVVTPVAALFNINVWLCGGNDLLRIFIEKDEDKKKYGVGRANQIADGKLEKFWEERQ